MKKTNWIAVLGLSIVALVLGGAFLSDYADKANREKQIAELTAQSEQMEKLKTENYTEPKIGMLLSKFTKLCGDDGSVTTHESGEVKITRIIITDFGKNPSECAGAFTFINNKLETITR